MTDLTPGPVPPNFNIAEAERALTEPTAAHTAFDIGETAQGSVFWGSYITGKLSVGEAEAARSILRHWIAEAKAAERLKDAAPDLLAACKGLVDYHNGGSSPQHLKAVALARAAIAKAEGRS